MTLDTNIQTLLDSRDKRLGTTYSTHVLPCFIASDSLNSGWTNPKYNGCFSKEFSSVFRGASEAASDLSDFFYRQFRHRMSLSLISCAVLFSVSLIFFCRAPTQILQTIVIGVAIEVSALFPFWLSFAENFQYKVMNVVGFLAKNYQMITRFCNTRLQNFPVYLPSPAAAASTPSRKGADSSLIGDGKKSVVFLECFPDFDLTEIVHYHLPKWLPEKEVRAGGREYRFSIGRSSPSVHSSEIEVLRKGVVL